MKAVSVFLIGGLACALAWSVPGAPKLSAQASPLRGTEAQGPNVVVLMTDDQDAASLEKMPTVQRLLVDEGVRFKNAIASYPLCCPSRATFQTGQYAHNHGVLSNKPPDGGYPAFDASETLPVWLDRSGYATAHVGKYLNEYLKDDALPPGWDRWFGVVEPASRYFNLHVNDQGVFTKFGHDDPADYSTDLITDRAVEFIEAREYGDSPIFLSVGYVAPHVGRSFQERGSHCDRQGPEPAPRHLRAFIREKLARGPAFDEDDVSDKPAAVRSLPRIGGRRLEQMTEKYRCRLEALLSVDEGVGRIVSALSGAGELEDTLIVYVSDNGFIQGDHRIPGGKSLPYESVIKIPMVVRGPGVATGETAPGVVSNVDVVPTLLDATGAEPGLVQDGRSFAKALRNPEVQDRRAVLIESRVPPHQFIGVRTQRFTYVERDTGELELYDLKEDPSQLQNLDEDPSYKETRKDLGNLLDRLRNCSGATCG